METDPCRKNLKSKISWHCPFKRRMYRHLDFFEDRTPSSGHVRGGHHTVHPVIRTSRGMCAPLPGMRNYQRRRIPSSRPLKKGVSSSGFIRSGRSASSGPHRNFLWVWRTRYSGPFYSRHPDLLMEKGLIDAARRRERPRHPDVR